MIQLFRAHMPIEVDAPLLETLHSGQLTQGPKVEEFERKFERAMGWRSGAALALNSGTSALTLALRLCGVEGGEVITSPMTCMATNTPILDNRATPVWADVDPDSGLIDPNDARKQITENTRAVVGVDWGGAPCDWWALGRLGKYTVRDAAHALGARAIHPATFTAYSLQAIKHITTVDGGVLGVRSPRDYGRAKLLRWYGLDREGPRGDFRCEEDVTEWGYKFHMNDVAATIGIVQLDHLDRIVAAHRANAAYYDANLPPFVRSAVPVGKRNDSAYWLYTVLLKDRQTRDAFMAHMNASGVQCSKVHARMDGHTLWRKYTTRPLPGVTAFYERECCIPVHWALTPEDRVTIVRAMHDFKEERGI